MKNDPMGDRFKRYEAATQQLLPRRTYTIIRVDGKSFHTVLRVFEKPFDEEVANGMDAVAIALMQNIQGSVFAYTQSDEVSILLQDFATTTTDAWFDGNVQKMTSISASIATSAFGPWADGYFDSRVFTIPDPVEVANYFIWRQRDAVRNSIQALGQSVFGPKALHGVDTTNLLHMLDDREIHWAEMPGRFTHGALVQRELRVVGVDPENGATLRTEYVARPVEDAWTVDFLLPLLPRPHVGYLS